MRSTAAEALFASRTYDLRSAGQMMQRHSRQFGDEYDDLLEAIQDGKLGLMNPLL